ncbi:4Fe-4S binding protein [Oceanithermus desulfurans]
MTACEEETGVLARDAQGRPFLDFLRAGCTFCRACLDACPEGVLAEPGRSPLAEVWIETGACLAHQGVVCVACKQACPEDAVIFEGMMRPRINEACTGCGLCVPACPVEAVAWSG